jgi:hypothetical protein
MASETIILNWTAETESDKTLDEGRGEVIVIKCNGVPMMRYPRMHYEMRDDTRSALEELARKLALLDHPLAIVRMIGSGPDA